ncbi:haloacid dehalogenase [Halobacteriales archaeon QS_4_69_34]|nr:MAG: haloacid dehalogenase [Halobacteriales archaeon QS_4_69_34]
MTLEAVVFDLDGTLCERRRPGSEVLAVAFEAVGVEPFFTLDEYHAKLDAIGDTDSDVHRRVRCFEALATERSREPAVGRAVAEAYETERDYTDVRFCPGAEAALAALGERYPLALVTNGGPDTQRPKIGSLDLESRFEEIVFAGHETAAKPDPEPFEVALDALDIRPEEAIYVGNSLDHDIAGAHAAGMEACWVRGDSDAATADDVPEYVLDSLADYGELP